MSSYSIEFSVKVSVSSSCSESQLRDHAEGLAQSIASQIRNMKYDEWRKTIYVNYDEPVSAELDFEVSLDK